MSEHEKEKLFSLWLSQTLTAEQQQQFEQLCLSDLDFAARVESLNLTSEIGLQHQQITTPHWDKESFFEVKKNISWWHWQGWPITSMAFSLLAVLMVVSGFNIEYSKERISIGFSNQISNATVDALVQQRLEEYKTSSNEIFAQYLTALKDQQLSTNSQLTEYLLTSSRQERREDFAELFKLINQQRYDDQVFFARQLNDLQDEISFKTGVPIDSVQPITDIMLDE